MPSAPILADQGVKAVAAGDYKDGIAKLTEALKERPAPLWLLERSKAYLRTKDFHLALHDAERALRVAFDRANRDQMIEAQIRRAITLFRIGHYADADLCAHWAVRLCEGAKASEDDGQQTKVDDNGDYTARPSDLEDTTKANRSEGLAAALAGTGARSKETALRNQAITWRLQALTQMNQLPPGHRGRKPTVVKFPNPSEKPPTQVIENEEDMTIVKEGPSAPPTSGDDEASLRKAWEAMWDTFRAIHLEKSKDIRSSFYQTDSTLNIDFFVKNVPKEEFTVVSQPSTVTMRPIPGIFKDTVVLYLAGNIKPNETKYTVKSMKVELALQKERPGKWPVLRRQNAEVVDSIALSSSPAASFVQFQSLVESLGFKKPADLDLPDLAQSRDAWYETVLEKLRAGVSSASDSEASGAAVKATSNQQTAQATQSKPDAGDSKTATTGPLAEKTSASTGPSYPTSSKKGPQNWDTIADPDEEGEEDKDVNSFFQSLYKNADPDTKRAMMKSYVESNGTSLSTSWAEAEKKTYETQAPDGAEAKKWDS
ncbi:SGS domain-containing protein [Xylariomycetidae sp. FL0641]|nr:SGS domain-containing protein [Xylariomycetidae sp. FL0641]